MAEANPKQDFSKQISETRQCIKDTFKKSHSALVARENILLARVDIIECEYNQKIRQQNELTQSLNEMKSYSAEKLKANQFTNARGKIITMLDEQLTELTADTDTKIEFVWELFSLLSYLLVVFTLDNILTRANRIFSLATNAE